jgi:transposase
MILDLHSLEIFIRPGVTDMRKQTNGLSLIVEENMQKNPGSGNLYLFCNRNRRLIKALYWDRNGFCLWQKRLERDKFPWPSNNREAHQISEDQLMMLLSGIDFWHMHQELHYQQMN